MIEILGGIFFTMGLAWMFVFILFSFREKAFWSNVRFRLFVWAALTIWAWYGPAQPSLENDLNMVQALRVFVLGGWLGACLTIGLYLIMHRARRLPSQDATDRTRRGH